ncbi:ankyrin [Dendrothele bispora CBS 962.96]|uniref:Ankyrin n=1 Tax=Dendrothele bispora (strain CBS 962.96) TaxID=1314807 RepID=A0A4S8LPV1_DENBC|nr:ankyrin [Dendrothele bispora CBS 962.96]
MFKVVNMEQSFKPPLIKKNWAIFELLLEKGADPNVQGGQYGTVLQAASFTWNQAICELLLKKGADPDVQGGKYGTALQAASYTGNQAIVELLLEKGADPNIQGEILTLKLIEFTLKVHIPRW